MCVTYRNACIHLKTCMFAHKHVYVSLLKHKCLKVKHVSVSCLYSAPRGVVDGNVVK